MSYSDDAAVADDGPLQAFALDLCSEDKGNIQGLCWGGRTPYGRGQGYPAGPPIASRQALSEVLGDALSGVFMSHNLAHYSGPLAPTLFIPYAPFNVRPRFIPTPESVCAEQDFVYMLGDHHDWAQHVKFVANLLTPAAGHVTQFRGHYGDTPLAEEKNALYDVYLGTLEDSLADIDNDYGLQVWEQMSAYI